MHVCHGVDYVIDYVLLFVTLKREARLMNPIFGSAPDPKDEEPTLGAKESIQGERLEESVRTYCSALLGERVLSHSPTLPDQVVRSGCVGFVPTSNEYSFRFHQIMVLRQATSNLGYLLSPLRHSVLLEAAPVNEGLVEFMTNNLTKSNQELPSSESVWSGTMNSADYSKLEDCLLRGVDPAVWGVDLLDWRSSSSTFLSSAGFDSHEDLNQTLTCLRLVEKLVEKQDARERVLRASQSTVEEYLVQSLATLRMARGDFSG